MHRGIIRAAVVSAAVLAISTLGGTAANAATDTGWVPDGPYEPLTIDACGTSITITDKVNQVESRTREDDRGNVRTDYRGTYIVKVTSLDGRKVVLDNSGPYSVFEYANGDTYVPVKAPGLIFPQGDGERAVFKKAGLPAVFYYTKGRLELFIPADGKEKVLTRPKDPVSICKLLR